jgi:hypothetical protein
MLARDRAGSSHPQSCVADVIEIPGYRILRPLGHGGMATVYLALQESVQREVALKVMSPTLLADPGFGERFLREARIAAKLHHRHVVAVHDVGRAGDYHYIAMEYVGGGPLLDPNGGPRPVPFALRVIREIASALHYAHSKGFVHRDVKPDNILLREDGSAVLTDFGIARASDSATHMTRTGTVVGTPHYMSPEQARGRTLDGRSDLYSLGIVLYELLVGQVPYQAEDSLTVGIMHITQPVPVLPERLRALQPLLDRMLAKSPEERYPNGQAVADAIEQYEIAMARGDWPDGNSASDAARQAASTRDAPTRRAPGLMPSGRTNSRAEPRIGEFDDIAAAVMRQPLGRAPRPRARRGGAWLLVLFGLLVVGGGYAIWHFQDRLRALLPRTELNELLLRGEKALAEGRLVGNDGNSARELFQAARTLDLDSEQARTGLIRVGARLLERASAAITRNDFAAAREALNAAGEVLGGGAEIEELKARLHQAETRNTEVAELLARADRELAAGHLLGSGSAAEAYQKVLDADGANALAINGLNKVGEALARQAREAVAAGNVELANQRLGDLSQLSPNHPAIPELRAALANARADTNQAIAQALDRAEAAARAGKVSGEEGAFALFQAVLRREPNNARAKTGLRKAAQALIVQADAALDSDQLGEAEQLLRQVEAVVPDLAELRAAKTRLREARERRDIANQKAQLAPAEQARVEQLLSEAEKAMAAGDLNRTPVDCAYDKFRAVLRIDGNNARALAGLARIPVRAKELFEQALERGTPFKARDYVAAVEETEPNDPALPAMRERLANVLLDQAEARLQQNRRSEAAAAVRAARELSPHNPRLAELEARLAALPASGG